MSISMWCRRLNKNKHSSSGGQGAGEPDLQPRGVARSIIINLTNIWKILKKNPKTENRFLNLVTHGKTENAGWKCSYRNSFGFFGSVTFRYKTRFDRVKVV